MLTLALASTTIAAAMLASGAFAPSRAASGDAAPPTDPPGLRDRPTMTIRVYAAPDVPDSLLRRALAEADAVWRDSGFRFEWLLVRGGLLADDAAIVSPLLTPRVVVSDERGMDVGSEDARPLGWLIFEGGSRPRQEIHVSRLNATWLLTRSVGIVGPVDHMPPIQQEMLLARAMGRALAHELGHYLLESKVHTAEGLMRATQPAAALFGTHRGAYVIDAAQRGVVARRLSPNRESGVSGR